MRSLRQGKARQLLLRMNLHRPHHHYRVPTRLMVIPSFLGFVRDLWQHFRVPLRAFEKGKWIRSRKLETANPGAVIAQVRTIHSMIMIFDIGLVLLWQGPQALSHDNLALLEVPSIFVWFTNQLLIYYHVIFKTKPKASQQYNGLANFAYISNLSNHGQR